MSIFEEIFSHWGSSFITFAKFSEKLTRSCAYKTVRNYSFLKNFANVINENPLLKTPVGALKGQRHQGAILEQLKRCFIYLFIFLNITKYT